MGSGKTVLRAVFGFLVLGAVVYSGAELRQFAASSRDAAVSRAGGDRGVVLPEPQRRWTVRVDGWSLQVEVARLRPEPPVPVSRGVASEEFSSPYDPIIRREAGKLGLDWRLVSAVIYEESRFRSDRTSPSGAYGLMQIRPIAARQVGATDYHTPRDNIVAGVRYLKHLKQLFRKAQGRDRLALMLAAYNMGPGHVRDAQVLAKRFGYDPWRWTGNIERLLPLLEQPAIVRGLRHGLAHGGGAAAYVNRVLRRYARHLRAG